MMAIMVRPVYDQAQYNIFERSRVEFDFANLYAKYKYGLTTFSPLSSGILTVKYSNGVPEDARLSSGLAKDRMVDFEGKVAQAVKLTEVAKEIGATVAQFSIAWAAANEHVSTVILGATSVAQLDENLKAIPFVDRITLEIRAKVDAIVPFVPEVVPRAKPLVYGLREQFL